MLTLLRLAFIHAWHLDYFCYWMLSIVLLFLNSLMHQLLCFSVMLYKYIFIVVLYIGLCAEYLLANALFSLALIITAAVCIVIPDHAGTAL